MDLVWQTTRFELDLSRPLVMGIVNATPDSFSDGGRYQDTHDALAHAERLLKEGAAILDLGGESTRPGAKVVPVDQELQRLLPVLKELVRWQVPISVDTYKPAVMQAVLDLGVDIINDIWALRQPGAEAVVAGHPRCGVCLMHMHREPQSMQLQPLDGDVMALVEDFLAERLVRLHSLGVDARRLLLDPGIGFGKTLAQNFRLLARQSDFLSLGRPILAGWSRKSSLGVVLVQEGQVPEATERKTASVAAALLAVERGASVLRVHDVKDTVEALKVWQAVNDFA
jgi:dihydropteroate synthase